MHEALDLIHVCYNFTMVSLVIDIQSGLVRGALVSFEKDDIPNIIHLVSRAIVHKGHPKGDFLTEAMFSAVHEVSSQVVREGISRMKLSLASIASVHYILSSPWIISQAKTINIQYDVDTEITESMINKILDEERVSLLSKFKKEDLSQKYDFDLTFIEQKVFDVRLNGYSVFKYEGKKTKRFDISFAVTLSSQKILDKIHEAVSRTVHIKEKYHHSGLILQYIALRSLIDKQEYMSVHVHGELTDIIVIKKGLSSSIASFPHGISTFFRKMSTLLRNTIETSSSMVSMYVDNHIHDIEKNRIKKVLAPLIKDWQSQLLKSFTANQNNKIISSKDIASSDSIPNFAPKLVYLSVCSSSNKYYKIFKEALEEMGFEVVTFDKSLMKIYMTALSQLSNI